MASTSVLLSVILVRNKHGLGSPSELPSMLSAILAPIFAILSHAAAVISIERAHFHGKFRIPLVLVSILIWEPISSGIYIEESIYG